MCSLLYASTSLLSKIRTCLITSALITPSWIIMQSGSGKKQYKPMKRKIENVDVVSWRIKLPIIFLLLSKGFGYARAQHMGLTWEWRGVFMAEKCLFLIITIVKPYYILKAFKLLVQTRLLWYNLKCFTIQHNHKKNNLFEHPKHN